MLYKVGSLSLDHKPIHIISLLLHYALFVNHIDLLLGSPVQNASKNGTDLGGIQAPMASIPETIISLDNFRSSLTDLLEDFRIAVDKNQSSLDPLVESDKPLTLNDIRNIEHNGDNPLDPSKIDSEERAPDQISSELPPEQTTVAKENKTSANHITGRGVINEVCGMNYFRTRFYSLNI